MSSRELMIHLAIWPNVAWILFVLFGLFMIKFPEWLMAWEEHKMILQKLQQAPETQDSPLKQPTGGMHRLDHPTQEIQKSSPSNDQSDAVPS